MGNMPTYEQLLREGELASVSNASAFSWRGMLFDASNSSRVRLIPDFKLRLFHYRQGEYWRGGCEKSEFACSVIWPHYDDYILPSELSDFLDAAVPQGWVIEI